jgi:serine/threonine protein phosphatase 1
MPVRKLLNLVKPKTLSHRVPDGVRVYAVGDIHGRLDLLDRLLDDIAANNARRPLAHTEIIFLGDLVDRGPDSAGVVERLLTFSKGLVPTRFLMGNHEEVFLRVLAGDAKAMRFFLRIGGRATVMSYGFDAAEYAALDFETLTERLIERVPRAHVAFLSSFEEMIELGDYLFVHAGIRPGVNLDAQRVSDLRWIRDDFLDCRDDHGKLVVHGHSITDEVDLKPNRIGIDTGAFDSGRLTAIGLEGAERWFLST